MPPTRVYAGFQPAQLRTLDKLAAKLGLDRPNVIKLAVARLAETEGVK